MCAKIFSGQILTLCYNIFIWSENLQYSKEIFKKLYIPLTVALLKSTILA